ncbi:MAG: 50S ribosomal protein L21 [Saprospiraceae bacterium]|nr:50S ribosomal protein L21 [Saprospiraceae bacterium]
MYAIVDIKGQQVKVQEGAELFVNRIDASAGEKIAFDKVLLVDQGDNVQIGTPHLKSTVNVTVLEHVKGDKVLVFKRKRRKGYKVKNGHRQQYTKIKVDAISL